MTNSVLAQLAALPAKTTAELKQLWRELYDREPRSFNRDFLRRIEFRSWPMAGCRRVEAKLDRLIAAERRGCPVSLRSAAEIGQSRAPG